MRIRMLAVLVLLALCQSTSAGASTAQLPLSDIGWIVVDDAHSHVFVTGAQSGAPGQDNAIAVMNFDGTLDTTITGEPGAGGMALAGGRLYVAGCDTTSIDVFDTATLTKVDTLSTSFPMKFPCDLAVTNGRVWVDEPLSDPGPIEPASVTIASPHTEKHIYPGGGAAFTTDPADPTMLVTGQVDAIPTWFSLWDTSTDPITQTTFAPNTNGAGLPTNGSAIKHDGSQLLVLDQGILGYQLPDLTTTGDWYMPDSTTPMADSLVQSPDGTRLALGTRTSQGEAALNIFKEQTGSQTAYNVTQFGVQGSVAALAFSADNSHLFVGINTDTGPVLEVDTDALTASSQIQNLESHPVIPDPKVPGATVSLSGTLRLLDGASAASKHVHLTELRPDSSTLDIGNVTTNSIGDFQLAATESLMQEGTYTFTANYAGDAGHLASPPVTTEVRVAKITSDLQLSATPSIVSPGEGIQLNGTLSFGDGSPAAGADVDVSVKRPDGSTADLGSQPISADNTFQLEPDEAMTQIGTYIFTATYAGDPTHAVAQMSAAVQVQLISTTLRLTVGRSTVVYGKGTRLTAHLNGAPQGSTVRIVRTVAGVTTIIATGAVDSLGRFSVPVTPKVSATYRATYSGDSSHASSTSGVRSIGVEPIIYGALSRGYGHSGAYHLYRYAAGCAGRGTGCPSFTEKVIPNMRGKRVYMLIQQHTSRGWKSVAAYRKSLNRRSVAVFKIRYLRSTVIGKSYRVIAAFRGNASYSAVAWGAWYFRITR